MMLLFASIGNYLIPNAYAEDQKSIRNKKIYDAEWAFSQKIIKAKEDYNKIISDPKITNEEKIKANVNKNKIITDAKLAKDKAIADAWNEFNVVTKTKESTEKSKFCFLWWCW